MSLGTRYSPIRRRLLQAPSPPALTWWMKAGMGKKVFWRNCYNRNRWMGCLLPQFLKESCKNFQTARNVSSLGLDTKLSHACPYLPVQNDFPVARLFPITIINAVTVQRAFLLSVHVMHPAKQTFVSVFSAKASYCCTDQQTVRTIRRLHLFLNLSNSRN